MGLCREFLPFFFFNDTATTEIYTLSLHDALPISQRDEAVGEAERAAAEYERAQRGEALMREPSRPEARRPDLDRKSTRLNSSHSQISYAVFCLKKKNSARGGGGALSSAFAHSPRN